jgi:hypothetical protein
MRISFLLVVLALAVVALALCLPLTDKDFVATRRTPKDEVAYAVEQEAARLAANVDADGWLAPMTPVGEFTAEYEYFPRNSAVTVRCKSPRIVITRTVMNQRHFGEMPVFGMATGGAGTFAAFLTVHRLRIGRNQ